jgi:hypothetical protein
MADRLDQHLDNIRETALSDLRTLADSGGGMGVFFLAIPIIDALARAACGNNSYWTKFASLYMPRLSLLAPELYHEFRNPGTHALSASSRFRFVSADEDRWAHSLGADLDGQAVFVLHAGEFCTDVENAFEAVRRQAQKDTDLRGRMLRRFKAHPPIGRIKVSGGFHSSIGAVRAVSGSSW